MKLGIDASRAFEPNRTGVGLYAFGIIRGLSRVIPPEHEVFLYTREQILKRREDFPKHFHHKKLSWPPKYFWTHGRLSLEMFLKKPDVLFIPGHVLPLYHPKNSVVMIHDVAFLFFPECYSRFQYRYQQWFVNFVKKQARAVIVPSQATKNDLIQHFGYDEKKITVIHHGFDPGSFANTSFLNEEIILEKYGIKKPYFLTVGRVELKKNLDTLLLAFEKLCGQFPNGKINLVLAGKPGHGYEKIKKILSGMKYQDRVKELGYVSEEDLPVLFQNALAYLFPSRYEGFGFPLLQAQAAGIPVLASNTSSLPEVAGEGALYVDSSSVDDLSNNMRRILSDATLRGDLIMKGKENLKRFSWQKCAEQTWEAVKG